MQSKEETGPAAWLIVAAAGVRAAFGVVMAVDAWLKWQPSFAAHYRGLSPKCREFPARLARALVQFLATDRPAACRILYLGDQDY